MDGSIPADIIEGFFGYNFIETIAKVSGQDAASCYSCGYGENCNVGVHRMLHGDVKITLEMIPDVNKQPEVITSAKAAGKLLGQRLTKA